MYCGKFRGFARSINKAWCHHEQYREESFSSQQPPVYSMRPYEDICDAHAHWEGIYNASMGPPVPPFSAHSFLPLSSSLPTLEKSPNSQQQQHSPRSRRAIGLTPPARGSGRARAGRSSGRQSSQRTREPSRDSRSGTPSPSGPPPEPMQYNSYGQSGSGSSGSAGGSGSGSGNFGRKAIPGDELGTY